LQAAALEAAANAIVITDASGTILWVNRAFADLTGYGPEESIGQNSRILKSWSHDDSFYKDLWSTIQSGGVWRGEITNRKKDGFLYTEEMTITPVRSPSGETTNYVAIKQDVTERKKLEAQYRQAQKMESVGRLAGGVAHDFNNILGVIKGYSEISLENLEPEHSVAKNLRKIQVAADRAVSLTRQLLAFSRQQLVNPRIVDLNVIVQGMGDMLQRLVGDDVSMTVKPTIPLGGINADVGQLEQVLMNLAVNARDAMADGGPITIETRNVELDETYQRKHEPVRPGPYVMLSMSDSGCGMDDTTKASIFEPFFTTKEVGKGTGLGLATVYGIVKQSGGYIWVYSEPDKGTTFKLFFPRVSEVTEAPAEVAERAEPAGGSETILLVEDDEGLREMITTSLRNAGYAVLETGKAQAALELMAKHRRTVHLLLSDIVMPQTSGVQLFNLLKVSAPDLKVIFMSGYATEMLGRHDPLPPESAFIEKPFARDSLLTTIRTVLREQAGS
jgi:PAS domain S-box-containing protein